jgi:hypothetical protein
VVCGNQDINKEICAEKYTIFFVFIGGGIIFSAPNNQLFNRKNKKGIQNLTFCFFID